MAASVLPSSGKSDIHRNHSSRGKPLRSHSPCHALPLHLQDPNYPRLRRRRQSALSTHSFDVNASVPSTPTSPFNAHQHKSKPRSHTYFVFPPTMYSPISSQSSSPVGWANSPNGNPPPLGYSNHPLSQTNSHSQETRSYSMDLLRIPSATLPLKPPSVIQSRRKSCDISELESASNHLQQSPLATVKSLDMLEDRQEQIDHSGSLMKRQSYGNMSPVIPPFTPSGHTPSMRLSFDTLDRRGTSSHRRRGSRRPYHVIHPISTNHSYQNVILQDPVHPIHQSHYPRHVVDYNDTDSTLPVGYRYSQPIGHMTTGHMTTTTGHMTRDTSSSSLFSRPPEVNNWYDGSNTSLCTSSCTGQQYFNKRASGSTGYLTPVSSTHNCNSSNRPMSMHSHYKFRRELIIWQLSTCISTVQQKNFSGIQ